MTDRIVSYRDFDPIRLIIGDVKNTKNKKGETSIFIEFFYYFGEFGPDGSIDKSKLYPFMLELPKFNAYKITEKRDYKTREIVPNSFMFFHVLNIDTNEEHAIFFRVLNAIYDIAKAAILSRGMVSINKKPLTSPDMFDQIINKLYSTGEGKDEKKTPYYYYTMEMNDKTKIWAPAYDTDRNGNVRLDDNGLPIIIPKKVVNDDILRVNGFKPFTHKTVDKIQFSMTGPPCFNKVRNSVTVVDIPEREEYTQKNTFDSITKNSEVMNKFRGFFSGTDDNMMTNIGVKPSDLPPPTNLSITKPDPVTSTPSSGLSALMKGRPGFPSRGTDRVSQLD